MSLENGKCSNCGGILILESSKEKAICKFCGSEIIVPTAIQKLRVDGIATLDAILLAAQRAMEEYDFDKALKKYNEALNLAPDDYRIIWGIYLCERETSLFHIQRKGYVKYDGDGPSTLTELINKYANRAYNQAPDDIKPYYYRIMQEDSNLIEGLKSPQKKRGCYIATCVYGSYDCAEVWTLRRYRDFTLQKSWYGRLFIKLYYILAPMTVKVFGKSKWFNRFWKKRLDKLVRKLKDRAYEDLPYVD